MEPAQYEVMFRVEETHWWYEALHELIFSTLDRLRPDWRQKTILDAGCGTGAILRRLGAPERNCGIDLAPEAIDFCQQRGLTNAKAGDICALPYADDTFDIVICASVLYHQWVRDLPAAINELKRVMKRDGVILINVPAFTFLGSAHDRAVMTARRFRKRELRHLLQSAGLKIVDINYWTMLLFPAALAARTFGLSKTGQDFDRTDGIMQRALRRIMWLDVLLAQRLPLPFGVALFAVAQKL